MKEKRSREEWVGAIKGASDLGLVFERANQALIERQAWGDDPTGSLCAALMWAEFFFPMDALESGAIIGYGKAERSALLKAGEEAAKAVACALLSPLPRVNNNGEEINEWGLRESWTRVSEAAQDSAFNSWRENKLSSVYSVDIFGGMSRRGAQTELWDRALNKESPLSVSEILLAPAERRIREHYDEKSGLELGRQWELASEDPAGVRRLMESSGASFILVGPAGGMKSIAKGASILLESYGSLASLIGVPSMAVGLGLEGLALNMSDDTAYAYYEPSLNLMAFDHAPAHLGHEWTHLLETRIGQSGSKNQKEALAKLLKGAFEIPPDPKLLAEFSGPLFEQIAEGLGGFLKTKGRESSIANHCVETPGEELTLRCDEAFLEMAKRAAKKGKKEWDHFLISHKDPSGPAIIPSGSVLYFKAIREGLGLQAGADKPGACDFLREARELDELREGPYYAKPKELIARVAEGYFSRLAAPPSISVGGEHLPREGEALELEGRYKNLLQAFAAEPSRLLGRRVRSQLIELERSNPAALEGIGLEAWRAERYAKPKPAKAWGRRKG